ncbi:MAG: hypothetical protein K6343_01135, partial [Caldisericaceae bacterium]
GLDSQLACLILKSQGIEVTPVFFETYFFKAEPIKRFAEEIGLELRIVDISEEHLKIVKNPQNGYGRFMNPCIDCHMLMIKKAKEIMEKEGYDFIATGEVLDERPFSQTMNALKKIEKSLNLGNKILRPLSQKVLEETEIEKKGLVKRDLLLDIRGRSRKKQLELAKMFNLKEFQSPASGCILTDPEYAKRLKEIKKLNANFDRNDSIIIRNGRIFIESQTVFIVGRNELENKKLLELLKKEDILLVPEFPGPTVLIRNFQREVNKEEVEKGIELLKQFSKKAPDDYYQKIKIIKGG